MKILAIQQLRRKARWSLAMVFVFFMPAFVVGAIDSFEPTSQWLAATITEQQLDLESFFSWFLLVGLGFAFVYVMRELRCPNCAISLPNVGLHAQNLASKKSKSRYCPHCGMDWHTSEVDDD